MKSIRLHTLNTCRIILRCIGHMHWLRLGIRYRILHLFLFVTAHFPHPFSVNFFGLSYRGNLQSHIDWHVYFYGAYERHLLFLLRDIAKAEGRTIFVDVGANVGQHSLFMSIVSDSVHSFEPYPRVRQFLENTIKDNNLSNVTVHPVGLGVRNETLPFYEPIGDNLGLGSFKGIHGRMDMKPSRELEVVRGDEYFLEKQIKGTNIFKIDVEGFERNVLEGLVETLRLERPFIVMEFTSEAHDAFGNEETLWELLPSEYSLYEIKGDVPILLMFSTLTYQLKPFNFNTTRGNILLAPNERSAFLKRPTLLSGMSQT